MKTIALALAASTLAVPAIAGPYVNVETNTTSTGNDFQSRDTDLHVGYENTIGSLDWFVQGGKTINAVDGTDSDSNFSGKFGGSYAVSEDLAAYGEISGATDGEDSDGDTVRNWGAKVGVKFTF